MSKSVSAGITRMPCTTFFADEAADLGVQVEGAPDGAGALELGDVGGADVPEAAAAAARPRAGSRRPARPRDLARAELLLRPQRQQVLLLRGHQLRAVDREQRSPFFTTSGEVDVEVLDVALELRVHVGEAALVGGHAADRADDFVDARLAHVLAAHAEQRAPLRRERHHRLPGTGRRGRPPPAVPACLQRRRNGSRSIGRSGRCPASETAVGCMGRVVGAAPLDVLTRPTAMLRDHSASSADGAIPRIVGHDRAGRHGSAHGAAGRARGLIGTSFIPQMGQSPGLSDTTVGCIGQ